MDYRQALLQKRTPTLRSSRKKELEDKKWKIIDKKKYRIKLKKLSDNKQAIVKVDKFPESSRTEFKDIFLRVFTLPLFEKVISRIPPISNLNLINNITVRYDIGNSIVWHTDIDISTILQYYSVRTYIQSNYKKCIRGTAGKRGNFREAFEEAKNILQLNITRNTYEKLHRYFLLDMNDADYFTEQFMSFIRLGEFIALDERLHYFTGHSPRFMKVVNKPHGKGHWISLAGVYLAETSDPYVCMFIPLESSTRLNIKHTPFDILKKVADTVYENNSEAMIVMDPYYLTQEGYCYMINHNYHFLASVNKSRFNHIFNKLPERDTVGTFKASHNSEDKTIAVRLRELQHGFGEKFIITNAFELQNNQSQDRIPCSAVYRSTFAVIDQANVGMAEIDYPLRRQGMESNYDSCYLLICEYNFDKLSKVLNPSIRERSLVASIDNFSKQLATLALSLQQQYKAAYNIYRVERITYNRDLRQEDEEKQKETSNDDSVVDENMSDDECDNDSDNYNKNDKPYDLRSSKRQTKDKRKKSEHHHQLWHSYFSSVPSSFSFTAQQLWADFNHHVSSLLPPIDTQHLSIDGSLRFLSHLISNKGIVGLSVNKPLSKRYKKEYKFNKDEYDAKNCEQDQEVVQIMIELEQQQVRRSARIKKSSSNM